MTTNFSAKCLLFSFSDEKRYVNNYQQPKVCQQLSVYNY